MPHVEESGFTPTSMEPPDDLPIRRSMAGEKATHTPEHVRVVVGLPLLRVFLLLCDLGRELLQLLPQPLILLAQSLVLLPVCKLAHQPLVFGFEIEIGFVEAVVRCICCARVFLVLVAR